MCVLICGVIKRHSYEKPDWMFLNHHLDCEAHLFRLYDMQENYEEWANTFTLVFT